MATGQAGAIDPDATGLLRELLQDDPRQLNLDGIPETAAEPEAIKEGLQHRDEARQYAAAKALMAMPRAAQLDQIDALRSSLGSDYGVHYLLASCTGCWSCMNAATWCRALAETAPQYAKSRIAGAWSCLRLGCGIKDHWSRILAAAIPGSRCSGAAVKWHSFSLKSKPLRTFVFLSFYSANLY